MPLTPRREAQGTAPVEARRQEEPRTGNHETCTRPLVCGLLAVGLGQVTFCSELQFVYKTEELAKTSSYDFLPDFFPQCFM